MRKERYGKAGRGPRAGAGGREKKGGEGPEQGVAKLAVPEKRKNFPYPVKNGAGRAFRRVPVKAGAVLLGTAVPGRGR